MSNKKFILVFFVALLLLAFGCLKKVGEQAPPSSSYLENDSSIVIKETPKNVSQQEYKKAEISDDEFDFNYSEENLYEILLEETLGNETELIEAPQEISSSCENELRDDNETDVDCGGVCPYKCAHGKRCISNSDCAASNCVLGICQRTRGGPGAYTDYEFYNEESTDSLEIYVTWLKRPEENVGIFAAFTFSFEAGQGGYIGIQRDGSLEKDRAIFSIWSIDDQSQTAECVSTGFDSSDLIRCGKATHSQSGEGNFGQALGMYAWKPGVEYLLRVEKVGEDSKGVLWRGTITDTETNITTEIGTIHLDDSRGYKGYGKLNPRAAVFLEYYYGHSGYCDENNVFSKVKWRGPYINGRLADRGYTWYPITCMYTRQYSPERGIVIQEAGGSIAWENKERDFWNSHSDSKSAE